MNDILPSAPLRIACSGAPSSPANTPRRHYGLATLRSTIATWEKRKRFRRALEQKSKDDPHLIDDIGLTRRQVEAEIAKPFWQA